MVHCPKFSLENIVTGNIQELYPKTNQTKVPFLRELSPEEDPLVIAITETHLRSKVKDEEMSNTTAYHLEQTEKLEVTEVP